LAVSFKKKKEKKHATAIPGLLSQRNEILYSHRNLYGSVHSRF
jgi:hypothetical protein